MEISHPNEARILSFVSGGTLQDYVEAVSCLTGLHIRVLGPDGAPIVQSGPANGPEDNGSSPPGAELEKVLPEAMEKAVTINTGSGKFLAVAPVRRRSELLGYLAVSGGAKPDGRPSSAFLSLSASHLGALAEKGYEIESLSAELVRVYEELSLIYNLTTRLSSQAELSDICRVVVEEIDKLLSPANLLVQLVDEDQGSFRTALCVGDHCDIADGYRPALEEGLVGLAYINHRSVVVCEVGDEKRHTAWPFPIRRLLAVPLMSGDKVIGMISAVDKKDGSEFSSREEKLVSAIASVAAIAMKNSQLYAEMKGSLEGFVNASVGAVDSRDPSMAGHSKRVALMSVSLAEKVSASDLPSFKSRFFTSEQLAEIEYAALLHDFGKVGVRESVLLKEAKLSAAEMATIRARFAYIRECRKREALEKKLALLSEGGPERYAEESPMIDAGLEEELSRLGWYVKIVETAVDPRVLSTDAPEVGRLSEIAEMTYAGPSGETLNFLTPEELLNLRVPKGSLNERERREVESHVTNSCLFLSRIPWMRSLPKIIDIVHAHHERLDGSGYPRGLKADEIPVQSRILAIADIYDALTASDRSYKNAVSPQKALFILEMEAEQGKLDPHLVRLFRDAKVYKSAEGWKPTPDAPPEGDSR